MKNTTIHTSKLNKFQNFEIKKAKQNQVKGGIVIEDLGEI